MRTRIASRPKTESPKSRLGESLTRLHSNPQPPRPQPWRDADLFQQWQEKWASRRQQITSRLERIESLLNRQSQKADEAQQLSVVGTAGDEQ